jgi:hypothetical protein
MDAIETAERGSWRGTRASDAHTNRVRAALLGLILFFAFASRAYMAVATPLLYDEYQWIALADQVSVDSDRLSLPLHGDQHPPGQVYFAAIGSWLLGRNLLGYRSASIVLGTVAVVLMYFLGRMLSGERAGMLAAFLLAANEYHIGISRLCTEKNYLTFVLLGLLLFERAVASPSLRRFLAFGGAMGLGILTKQTPVLWLPAFGLELLRRSGTRLLRHSGPWCALALIVLLASPDILWNLARNASTAGVAGERGAAYQLSRLTVGSWSWGPAALYFRPLYYHGVEPAVSEYASMTSAAGAIVLLGSIASISLLRSTQARFLQLLGFGTFFFFSLFTNPRGEFWWADLALLPFVALTGSVLSQRRRGRDTVAAIVAITMLIGAWRLVTTRDNYFPLELTTVHDDVIDRYRQSQRLLVVAERDVDHLDMCSLGMHPLPACGIYEAWFEAYERHLTAIPDTAGAVAPALAWPDLSPEDLQEETAWARAQLDRFRARRQ